VAETELPDGTSNAAVIQTAITLAAIAAIMVVLFLMCYFQIIETTPRPAIHNPA
jgi:hypothetical protein